MPDVDKLPHRGVLDTPTRENFQKLEQRFPITTDLIDDDAITAAQIAADAVGASEIAADAVGSSEIAAGAVGASELNIPWTTWSPSFTGFTVGNATVNARYQRVGAVGASVILFYFQVTLGTTSSVTGGINVSMPFSTANNFGSAAGRPHGTCTFRDDSAGTTYPGYLSVSSDDMTLNVMTLGATHVQRAATSGTSPFSWTTSDQFAGHGFYEADA